MRLGCSRRLTRLAAIVGGREGDLASRASGFPSLSNGLDSLTQADPALYNLLTASAPADHAGCPDSLGVPARPIRLHSGVPHLVGRTGAGLA